MPNFTDCSNPGAVLTFKIKRFPPGVGNRGDSDTKGQVQMRVGMLTKEIFKCLYHLSLPIGGGGGRVLPFLGHFILNL